jgi:ABC-type phosphate transport system substrate-binding protein
MKSKSWIPLLIGFWVVLGICNAYAQEFIVVVSKDSKISTLTTGNAKIIFMGKQSNWDSGAPILVVYPPIKAPQRQDFEKTVLGKTPFEIEKYWVRFAIIANEQAPVTLASDDLVASMVAANANAIGIVGKGFPIESKGLKKVTVTQ